MMFYKTESHMNMKSLLLWVKNFAPIWITLAAGMFYFKGAVIESIESTPHPELVFIIFASAGIAVLLLIYTQLQYQKEAQLIQKLRRGNSEGRSGILDGVRWDSDFSHTYRLLDELKWATLAVKASAIENEYLGSEIRVYNRLNLVNYIGGMLVGLGLIGTFVGLLATLQDLGKIFGLLATVGTKDVDPVTMFGNMITQLQEPMRGMSTAFVASLYGLLGSLVIGMAAMSVRKTGSKVCNEAREYLVKHIYDDLTIEVSDGELRHALPMNSISKSLEIIPASVEALVFSHGEMLNHMSNMLSEHRSVQDRIAAFDMKIQTHGHAIATEIKQIQELRQSQQNKPMVFMSLMSGITALSAVGMLAMLIVMNSNGVIWIHQGNEQVVSNPVTSQEPITAPVSQALDIKPEQSQPGQAQGALSVMPKPNEVKSAATASPGAATIKPETQQTTLPELNEASEGQYQKKNMVDPNLAGAVNRQPGKASQAKQLECAQGLIDCPSDGQMPMLTHMELNTARMTTKPNP
jgi:MotA/TolQ/ExbB proton channel family